ncbi:MAG TPA: sugar phosphate nucleotidyltransferase [Nitrospiria bacterium]|nr:sugar phosphate nucleotidyltransferase [Nitrospiria bacterium]
MERGLVSSRPMSPEGLRRDQSSDLYGVILAGGNGKRLASFVKRNYGLDEPKQFVAFTGKRTMIEHTTDRIETLIPKEKQLVVLDSRYRQTIHHYLREFPSENLVYQPINRETAPGILLPLARVLKNDPNSHIGIFPSDHFILEEGRFMEHIRFARNVNQQFPDKIVLFGIQPDAPEDEYGWIQPGEKILALNGIGINQVKTFHEKPDHETARQFLDKGYLWNTLIMVARASTLWKMVLDGAPGLQSSFNNIYDAMGTSEEEKVVRQEYEKMNSVNFSDLVLQKFPSRLLVLRIKDVFWSDWGNETRVLETLKRIGRSSNPNKRRLEKQEAAIFSVFQ